MFQMQIKIEKKNAQTGKPSFEWVSVCPTGGKPYQYPTEQEARQMLGICYGEVDPERKRVIKVDGAI